MIKRIFNIAKKRLVNLIIKNFDIPVDYTSRITENIGLDFLNPNQPKALLCYIPFDLVNSVIRGGITHCNQPEFYQMIRYFIDKGYALDICSYDYKGAVKDNYYDVILGFGDVFFRAKAVNPNVKNILWITENPYYISMSREKRRLEYFAERHGRLPKNYAFRSGRCFKEDDEKKCDHIITMGDISYLERNDAVVQRIFPTGFSDKTYIPSPETRDRKSFLCLASDGFIHKGYDLLLELFAMHADWKLYYCGDNLKGQADKIGVAIPENIIDCGFVKIPSEKFRKLCDTCSSILLFSCSEGMSTSLLTAMKMGLVPITCKGNGMEVCEDKVLFSDDYHLESIEKAIDNFIQISESEYTVLIKEIYHYANSTFNLDMFDRSFHQIMDKLLG